MKRRLISMLLAIAMVATLFAGVAINASAAGFAKATSIAVGDQVVFVCETAKDGTVEFTGISTTSTKYGIATVFGGSPAGTMVFDVVAGASDGTFAFQNGGKYLYWTSGNSVNLSATLDAKTSWTVTFTEDGNAVVTNVATTTRVLQYNMSNPRFACYTTTQTPIQIYKVDSSSCAHENNTFVETTAPTCTANGVLTYTCSDCGETWEQSTDKLEHNWDEGAETTAPGCTTTGVTTFTCADCGETKTAVIDATGHTFENGTCTACGFSQADIISYGIVGHLNVTAGNYIIGAIRAETYPNVYLATATVNNDWTVTSSFVTATDDAIDSSLLPADAAIITLTGDNTNGFTISMVNADGETVYLGYSEAKSRKLALSADYSNVLWLVVADSEGGVAFTTTDGSYTISQNSTAATAIRGYANSTIYTGLYLFREGGAEFEPVIVPEYYVAGTFNYWKAAEDKYKMTANEDGTYSFNLPLTAGAHAFKVTNGTWDSSWPSRNYDLFVGADCTAAITFNPETQEITVDGVIACEHASHTVEGACTICGTAIEHTYADGVCTICGAAEPVVPLYYIAGNFNGWQAADPSYLMTAADGIYTYSLALTAGSHSFKVTNGTWESAWPENNYELVAGADCTVTITFNPETKEITVDGLAACEHLSHSTDGICTICGTTVNHVFVDGLCSCGVTQTTIKYFVAGNFNEWTPDSAEYQMTLNGDVYTLSFSLTAGAYYFKVTDGTWDKAWPSDDYFFVNGGDSTITITFNPTTFEITVDGAIPCEHAKHTPEGLCTICGLSVEHTYADGYCTGCGAEKPVLNFFLNGYIDNADYVGNDYAFVDGKLVMTFEADSYIFIVDSLGNWYNTEAYCDTASATFVKGASEKMFVPSGVELTFTLVENEDGTVTVSYEEVKAPVIIPNVVLKNPTLAFEDEILYNVYFTVDNLTSVTEMGLVIFSDRLFEGTIADAIEVVPGYVANANGTYTSSTNGIPAKMLSDAVYFKVYAKLADGSYVYSDVAGYHAVAYANTILNSNASATAKALVVAMLNYGAAAQVSFDYKTDALMNAKLTADQLALIEAYSDSMVVDVPATTDKAGSFVMNGGYTSIYPTVSFEGAFAINYYFTPKFTPDNGVVNFYYWTIDAFNAADVLTPENASGTVAMTSTGSVYTNAIEGIAAKQIDEPVFIAGMYTNGGTNYTTPVIGYSLGAYCKNVAAKGNELGMATAVYGYYAKAYFAS